MKAPRIILDLRILAFTTLACLAVTVSAQDAIPQPLPTDRYDAMGTQSPFALASPVAPVAIPEASFATNWFVTGIGRLNDEDYVTIKARDLSAQFSLFGHETNPQTGVALASVNWSETIGKSTVILRKGTETAVLEFNEADMQAPSAPTASTHSPARQQPVSSTPRTGVGNPQPVSPPMQPARPPYVASSGAKLIRPGSANVLPPPTAIRPQAPGAPPNAQQPQNIRRRVPSINPPR